MEEYVADCSGGIKPDDSRLAYVKILLYDMQMKVPTGGDAKAWANHFKLDRKKNRVVLAGDEWLQQKVGQAFIPGFWLIDKDGRLAVECPKSAGAELYTKLLPKVGGLLGAKK